MRRQGRAHGAVAVHRYDHVGSSPAWILLLRASLLKKLNSTKRGAFFRRFCVSKVITSVQAHKSGVIIHIFRRAFKQKMQGAVTKMTKIASREGAALKNETNTGKKAIETKCANFKAMA